MTPITGSGARAAILGLLIALLAPLVPVAATPEAPGCPPGCRAWVARWAGPHGDIDTVKDVAATAGRVFVTGYVRQSNPSSPFDWATVAYEAQSGTPLWWDQYGGPPQASDFPEAMIPSPDGETLFVTGRRSDLDIATVAYDAATGQRRWEEVFDEGGDDSVFDIAVSPDGSRLFVAGTSVRPAVQGTSTDFTLLALDAATGAMLWKAHYDQLQFADNALRVAVSPDGERVFATGLSSGVVSFFDIVTLAYDAATGEQEWLARHDARGSEQPSALAVHPDGSLVFVTGDGGSPGVGSDFVTLAYDATTGDEVWASRYDGPASGIDVGRALATDGRLVYVSGDVSGATTDMAVVAYDAEDGGLRWATRYDGGLYDVGMSLSLDASRELLYATGTSQSSPGANNYVLLALDAPTGLRVWESVYDNGAADFASYGAVTPDGSLAFVAGYSEAPGGGPATRDYTTVAYRGGAKLRAQDGPHLLDAAGDANATGLGRDSRPASLDVADLHSARYETTYVSTPVGDDGVDHEPESLVIEIGTAARPASDWAPLSWAVSASSGGCRSTVRVGLPGQSIWWEQEEGCPSPGVSTPAGWTVTVTDQGLVVEAPFETLGEDGLSLLGPGAVLQATEATSAAGADQGRIVVDATPIGTGFRVGGDVPPDVPCTMNCPP
ncbi:MAG TPA: PQQ-binding-like beta-propeller repeat protein [Actinomycetota bacterium]